jgi:hypothetical protein
VLPIKVSDLGAGSMLDVVQELSKGDPVRRGCSPTILKTHLTL